MTRDARFWRAAVNRGATIGLAASIALASAIPFARAEPKAESSAKVIGSLRDALGIDRGENAWAKVRKTRKYSGMFRKLAAKIGRERAFMKEMKLPSKFSYMQALRIYTHFDFERAREIAVSLAKMGELNPRYIEEFITACRIWPLIKVYSERMPGCKVDPKLSMLVAAAESRLEERCKTRNREGYYDVGIYSINSRYAKRYEEFYSNHPYWIEGRDYTYTPNNLLLGVFIVRDRLLAAGCGGKSLAEMKAVELFRFYNAYTSCRPKFEDTDERHLNITLCFRYVKMLPLVDRLCATGELVKVNKSQIRIASAPNADRKRKSLSAGVAE
ncbi:MAG: hypothetical protein QW112_04165 [Candidatus Micrarchaeia archaeon]